MEERKFKPFFIIPSLVLIGCCCCLQLVAAEDSHFEEGPAVPVEVNPHDVWNYEHQQNWAQSYPNCNSKQQSPINIDTSKVILNRDYKLVFKNYEQDILFRLKNTQHTVNFDPMQLDQFPTIIPSWLPEPNEFELHDIHFHWGDGVGDCGSEHRVDNKFSTAEVHFVHFLKGLSKEQAMARPNSIVVIGVFIDEALSDSEPNYNGQFDEAISYLAQVSGHTKSEFYDAPVQFNPYNFLPQNKERFYYYDGSLTTPACSEVVDWVVMDEHVSISRESLEILIGMRGSSPGRELQEIGPNHRELQQINQRQIIATFEAKAPSAFRSALVFPITSARVLFQNVRSLSIKRLNPLNVIHYWHSLS